MKVKTQEIKKKILKTLKEKNGKEKTEEVKVAYQAPESETEDDDNASLNSDEELQLAFARGELKPGLNIPMEKPKVFVNDEDGLNRKLKDFYLNLSWIERLDITTPKPQLEGLGENDSAEKANQVLVENDFKRESIFIRQAQAAIASALPRLNKLGILTKRPEDYFAEMAKSDDHMKRVRETLLSKHAEIEKREKIRKLRELKKMGKQIQMEAEKKKQESKRKLKESIKKFKKGDKEDLQIELEDDFSGNKRAKRAARDENEEGENGRQKRGGPAANGKGAINGKDNKRSKKSLKKAEFKEKKYGFGGRKKRSKYNTAESYADVFDGKKPKPKGANSKFGNGASSKFGNGANSKFGNGANSKFGNGAGAKKFTNKNKNPKNKRR